jgi:voltage-gated potassium channel
MTEPTSLFDELDAKSVFRYLGASVIVVLSVGTVFYHFVEGFSWVDAYYFSVVTLATVGYGDLSPKTTVGKIFTTFYIFVGVGILATFFSFLVRRRAVRRISLMHAGEQEASENELMASPDIK